MNRAFQSIMIGYILLSSAAWASAPPYHWSTCFGDSVCQFPGSTVIDNRGHILLVGSYQGTIDLGGGSLPPSSPSEYNVFVAKFHAQGGHIWSHGFGGVNDQVGIWVDVDSQRNVYLTGHFSETIDFGGGPLTTGVWDTDIFLAKFDPQGAHVWSQGFGSTANQKPRCLCVDNLDNVFLVGYFEGMVDFGGEPLTSAGSWDIFMVKFASDGTHLWSQGIGGEWKQLSTAIAVDSGANVFITGGFIGTVDFGGGPLRSWGSGTPTLREWDIFLAKYSSSGTHLWSKRYGDIGAQAAHGLAIDSQGNAIITGVFNRDVDFGGGDVASTNFHDVFLAKFAPDSTHLWSFGFGSSSEDDDAGRWVAVDGSDNIVMIGSFEESIDFGGGPLIAEGETAVFLAGFNPDGEPIWSRGYRGAGNYDYSACVSISDADDIVITGPLWGSADFGGGPITSEGDLDVFLTRFGDLLTIVSPTQSLPTIRLQQNQPNPFNPSTVIRYETSQAGNVVLRIYSLAGELVKTLFDGAVEPGGHEFTWYGDDKRGQRVASGVYFYRVETSWGYQETRMLVMVQ